MPSILYETKKDLFLASLAQQLKTHIQDDLVKDLAKRYAANAEAFLREGTISALIGSVA
jgi:hypothetical protein